MATLEVSVVDRGATRRGIRLTRAGWAALATAIAVEAAGLVLGYPELVAIAVMFLLAIVAGLAIVSRRPALEGSRIIDPDRVVEGQEAMSQLTLTNRGRRTITSGTVQERFGTRVVPVDLPTIGPGESALVTVPLPTERRGVYRVGPLALERADPFGLARRTGQREDTSELRVYPRIHLIDPFPSGATRDLDGPNAGEAPEGGITFQNLRDYVPGDDLRLIHWRSFARTGHLMVRHNVDYHRPSSLVVLDTRPRVHTDESFEDAVRAAASIVLASHSRRFPFRLRTTCGRVLDQTTPRRRILDVFAELTPTGTLSLGELAAQSGRDAGGLSLAVVTGRATVDDLAGLGPLRNRFGSMTIARLGVTTGARTAYLPGAVLLNVTDSTEFTRSWQRRVRR